MPSKKTIRKVTSRPEAKEEFLTGEKFDAMTDRRAEAHDYSIANVFPRLGETGTMRDIIDLLDNRSA